MHPQQTQETRGGTAGRLAAVCTAHLFTVRMRGFLEAEVTSESTTEFPFKMTGLLMSLRKKRENYVTGISLK